MKRFGEACLDGWGEADQIDMVIEEMAELTLAISHWRRRRVSLRDVAEEIADVELMCLQMRSVLDARFEQGKSDFASVLVDEIAKHKVERTLERLKETNPEVYKIYYGEDEA